MTNNKNATGEFYAAMGRAISLWAETEQRLYGLYGAIMQPQLWVITSSTYHVMQTFRGKLTLVDAALKAAYPESSYPDLIKDWKSIHEELPGKSGKRNRIVHQVVSADADGNLHSRPDPFNAKSMLAEEYEKKRMYLEDICSASDEFIELSKRLYAFTQSLTPPPQMRR